MYPSVFQSKKAFEKIFQTSSTKNLQDNYGNTFAHYCVIYDKESELSKLKHLLNIKNHFGHTPKDLSLILGKETLPLSEKVLHVFSDKKQRLISLSPKEVKETFQFEYLDQVRFSKPSYYSWVVKKCFLKLQNMDIKWKNHWTVCMHAKNLSDRVFPPSYVKWVNPVIRYGLFAGIDIPQYTLVGEYTGILRKRTNRKDVYNDYIFGYVAADSSTPFVIDAKNFGNSTRFINHSEEPNLFSTWMISEGICHVILFARYQIPKGTQLTYDYGPHYWKKRSLPLEI